VTALKIDFATSIKAALDKSAIDEAIAAEISGLLDRLDAAAKRTNPDKPVKVVHSDDQIAAVARNLIRDRGLIGLVEQAMVDAAVTAAKAPASASAATK